MDCTSMPGDQGGHEAKSTPNAGCLLLNKLPVELVLQITDKLSFDSKLLLGQTCSPLRNILEHWYQLNTQLKNWTSREEVYNYLMCIGKERLDVWVCSDCLVLHEFCPSYLPDAIGAMVPRCPTQPRNRFDGQTLVVYHQSNVQLALKYARLPDRLGTIFGKYQEWLMSTHRGKASRLECSGIVYRITPRIVAGRFLVYRAHTYKHKAISTPRLTLGLTRHCCNWHVMDDNEVVVHISRSASTSDLPRMFPELHVLCKQCKTEVSIKRSGNTISTYVWEDLGKEALPREDISSKPPAKAAQGRAIEPKGVRELYESTIENLPAFYADAASELWSHEYGILCGGQDSAAEQQQSEETPKSSTLCDEHDKAAEQQ